ncbi:MAG: hypothetical protein OXT67_10140 [Zetaproteobacteria bacterium]|nr:hypothetical protein [Zetaproteobacteria bacterium]
MNVCFRKYVGFGVLMLGLIAPVLGSAQPARVVQSAAQGACMSPQLQAQIWEQFLHPRPKAPWYGMPAFELVACLSKSAPEGFDFIDGLGGFISRLGNVVEFRSYLEEYDDYLHREVSPQASFWVYLAALTYWRDVDFAPLKPFTRYVTLDVSIDWKRGLRWGGAAYEQRNQDLATYRSQYAEVLLQRFFARNHYRDRWGISRGDTQQAILTDGRRDTPEYILQELADFAEKYPGVTLKERLDSLYQAQLAERQPAPSRASTLRRRLAAQG